MAGRAGAGVTQNIKVREAISHAIDVDGIITHVLGGRGLKLGTVVNPMKFGYDPSIKPVPYDPAKSKQLLAEAGVAPGTKVEFMTYSGSIIASRQVGDAVSGYLSKVGLQTNHQHIEDIGRREDRDEQSPAFAHPPRRASSRMRRLFNTLMVVNCRVRF